MKKICEFKKKVVPLHTFCIVGSMHFSFCMTASACEKPNKLKIF